MTLALAPVAAWACQGAIGLPAELPPAIRPIQGTWLTHYRRYVIERATPRKD